MRILSWQPFFNPMYLVKDMLNDAMDVKIEMKKNLLQININMTTAERSLLSFQSAIPDRVQWGA